MNTSIFRRLCAVFALSAFLPFAAAAQAITTADAFFSSVSDTYAALKDYAANIAISSGSSGAMAGRVIFKKPDLLRIDFTNPANQTIVFNGDALTIYLPTYNVVLNQSVDKSSAGSGASLATPQGLSLMKRYYSISYETGPAPVAMEDSPAEQVIVLLLTRRSTTEIFRSIRLMVSPDAKMIRRIEARSISGDLIKFDFTNYAVNQGLLDTRFVYDSPASANMFNDFLFNE